MFLNFKCCLVLKTLRVIKALSVGDLLVMLIATQVTDGCQMSGPCLKENSFLTL